MHSFKTLLYGVAILIVLLAVESPVTARPLDVLRPIDPRAAPKLGGGGGGGLLSGIGKLFGGGKPSTPAPKPAPPPPAEKAPPPPAEKPAPPPAEKPAPPPAEKPPAPPAEKPPPPKEEPPPPKKTEPTKTDTKPSATDTKASATPTDACVLPRAPGDKKKCDDQAATCAKLQGCSKCVANAKCGFSKDTFQCVPKKGGLGSNQVSDRVGCPQMDQMQGIFQAKNAGAKTAGAKAGTNVPAAVTAEFARISSHVFNGEASSKTSGRHTSAKWTADNPGSKLEGELAGTNIQKFSNGKTGKTVWSSTSYSDLDIKNMCMVAIELGNRDGVTEGAYVVQTPFGKPACINHFAKGTGSCFPLGIDAPKAGLGKKCGSAGDDA